MKPEFKIEGDKALVNLVLETGVDADKDGVMSAKVSGTLSLELDGSEIVDELVKSNEFVEKIKSKLGL